MESVEFHRHVGERNILADVDEALRRAAAIRGVANPEAGLPSVR